MASYLGTSVMKATSSTMALASSVLGFDIVELWTEGNENKISCTYVHATEAMKKKYPDLITGHYPEHKREHKLSPTLCQWARESPGKYHWTLSDEAKDSTDRLSQTAPLASKNPLYNEISAPFKTEMAYLLDNSQIEGVRVYIIGFAIDKIKYKPSKLKFLSGLGYAIYVAAFVLDEDEEESANYKGDEKELDMKELFAPRPLGSHAALNTLNSQGGSNNELSMGVWSPKPSRTTTRPFNTAAPTLTRLPSHDDDQIGLNISPNSSPRKLAADMKSNAYETTTTTTNKTVTTQKSVQIVTPGGTVIDPTLRPATASPSLIPFSTQSNALNNNNQILDNSLVAVPPTWDPVDAFSFPVAQISVKSFVPDNLTFHSFEDLKHIADGSNSNIFLGKFLGTKVIVKLIKEDVQNNPVAVHEFDVEHGMLSRFSHPHIIRLLGAGMMPRRFIVIEYLGGGSLATVLENNKEKPGIAQRFFRKPTFTYTTLLSRSRDMADALDYLHTRCHPGAIIIHRDLKPDNVGFTSDGILKLFDFGLCTCVKAHDSSNDVYEMTGNTGSLRYMAPEVALRKSYNEKVDVYSYGIMIWQMARDRVPFKGLSKNEFFNSVVNGELRPQLDKAWPSRFSRLLNLCWHPDYVQRPTFKQIVEELDKLYVEARGGRPATPPTPPPPNGPQSTESMKFNPINPKESNKDRKSTWF